MLRVFLIQYPIVQLGQLAALLRDVPGLSSAAPTLRSSLQFFPQFPLPGLVGLVALPHVVQTVMQTYPGFAPTTLENGMQLAVLPVDYADFVAGSRPTQDTSAALDQFRAAVVSAIAALDAASLRAWRN
jgi:hypothetical protein